MTDLYDDTMVETAARIWWGNSGHDWDAGIEGEDKPHLLSEFRAVLDAMAPLIAAKALRDGQAAFERAADMAENQTGRTLNLVVAEAFGKRADKIERGQS